MRSTAVRRRASSGRPADARPELGHGSQARRRRSAAPGGGRDPTPRSRAGAGPGNRPHGRPEGLGLENIGLDTRLEADLGLDSLGRAELIARIERELGCRLPDEALLAPTPRDLLTCCGPTAAPEPPAPGAAPNPGRVQAARAAPDAARTLPEVLDWHSPPGAGRGAHPALRGRPGPAPHHLRRTLAGRGAHRRRARRAHGVEPGRTVALMLPTGMDYFAASSASCWPAASRCPSTRRRARSSSRTTCAATPASSTTPGPCC
jgi:hypothetical protein